MHMITVSATLPHPPDAVWRMVGDFGGLPAWSRAVLDCRVEGEGVNAHRVLTTAGGQIRERLDAYDPAARRFTYTPVSGSTLPVRGMRATIALTELGASQTRVDWHIEGEPLRDAAEVSAMLQARYAARLEELNAALKTSR